MGKRELAGSSGKCTAGSSTYITQSEAGWARPEQRLLHSVASFTQEDGGGTDLPYKSRQVIPGTPSQEEQSPPKQRPICLRFLQTKADVLDS